MSNATTADTSHMAATELARQVAAKLQGYPYEVCPECFGTAWRIICGVSDCVYHRYDCKAYPGRSMVFRPRHFSWLYNRAKCFDCGHIEAIMPVHD
jgi:hypothetical protein